jgi:hypothetical protein
MRVVYALVALSLLALPAHAVDALRLTYTVDGTPVTLERDNAGTIQVDGLPYPGLVLYRPQTGMVYYQYPEIPQWFAVPPGRAEAVSATTLKGPAWQKWPAQPDGQPSYRYAIKVPGGEDCGPLYASPGAGVQAGLSVADIWRILTTVAWINAGTAAPACDRLAIDNARGQLTGLPLHFNGPNGEWQLKELARTGIARIDLPVDAQPLDEASRLDILLRQFGPDERKNFLQNYGNLPIGQQINLVERALSGSGQQ